ncbi:MAG: hypothetical protein M1830_008974 [Pleopsidium flavum]|nr:MAG: hypothetical protein M1830_008974 [Pleopsidium flavum]
MRYFVTTLAFLAATTGVLATPIKMDDSEYGSQYPKPSYRLFDFTSEYQVKALPGNVVNGTTPAPGQPGAVGYYKLGLNADLNTICYNITLFGVTGAYQSPALTATHLHQGPKGGSGPPRVTFPNPVGDDYRRNAVGCVVGPFKTGIMVNGTDTGDNFTVAMIEANPAGFFADAHTTMFPLGVVRGQLKDC